jgi:hypothetical protein
MTLKLAPNNPPIPDPESVYLAYPRHCARYAGMKAISKAIGFIARSRNKTPQEAAMFLEERTARYAQSPYVRERIGDREKRQFIPHPATWFNAQRYDDDDVDWGYRAEPTPEDKSKVAERRRNAAEMKLEDLLTMRWNAESKRSSAVEYCRQQLYPDDILDPAIHALLLKLGVQIGDDYEPEIQVSDAMEGPRHAMSG